MAGRPTASHDEIRTSGRLTVLSGAAPALWLVFGLKLVAILAYGIMNPTLVLWLSDTRLITSGLGLQRDAYHHSAHDIV